MWKVSTINQGKAVQKLYIVFEGQIIQQPARIVGRVKRERSILVLYIRNRTITIGISTDFMLVI
jgi:hypothetical protein